MAEGGTYWAQAGHSDDEVTMRDSRSNPNRGSYDHHTRPVSERLETDGDSLLVFDSRRPSSMLNVSSCSTSDNNLSRGVTYPPPRIVHAQSVSGFSDTRMNIPSDGHLQQLPSDSALVLAELDTDIEPNRQPPLDLSLSENEGTPHPIRLYDVLARERDQNKAAKYRQIARLLLQLNMTEDSIVDVILQNGIPCMESRSKFFALHDNEGVPNNPGTRTNQPAQGAVMTTAIMPGNNAGVHRYPEYEDGTRRLGSYITWPGVFQSRNELCDAGLFYTGEGDKCRCYHCGKYIWQWELGDIPVVEHYNYNKECKIAAQAYIVYLQNRIDQVQIGQSTPVPSRQRPNSTGGSNSENKHRHRICQVCKLHEIGISQFKCGHIVCVRCVSPEPPDDGKRHCKIEGCGREIERTTPYDSTTLINGGQ